VVRRIDAVSFFVVIGSGGGINLGVTGSRGQFHSGGKISGNNEGTQFTFIGPDMDRA
jgi:hypothetical protein